MKGQTYLLKRCMSSILCIINKILKWDLLSLKKINLSFYIFFRFSSIVTFFCCRLLFLLAVIDLIHLIASLASFSLPTVLPAFHHHWYFILPYTLPIAQVNLFYAVFIIYLILDYSSNWYFCISDFYDDVNLYNDSTHNRKVHFSDLSSSCCASTIHTLLRSLVYSRINLLHGFYSSKLFFAWVQAYPWRLWGRTHAPVHAKWVHACPNWSMGENPKSSVSLENMEK